MVFLLDVLFCLTKAILFEVYFLYIELGIVLINLKLFFKCFPRWKGELGEKTNGIFSTGQTEVKKLLICYLHNFFWKDRGCQYLF